MSEKKFNWKLIFTGALVLCVLAVSFVVPSFAEDSVSVSFIGSYAFSLDNQDYLPSASPDVSLDVVHNIFCFGEDSPQPEDYYQREVLYNSIVLSTDPDNPTVIPYSDDIAFEDGRLADDSVVYYFIIESPVTSIWTRGSEFTGGIFGSIVSTLSGIFSNPAMSALIIGISLFSILVSFLMRFLKDRS